MFKSFTLDTIYKNLIWSHFYVKTMNLSTMFKKSRAKEQKNQTLSMA